MRMLSLLALSCVIVGLLLAGCGGSSPPAGNDPVDPAPRLSSIEGTATVEGDPGDYVLLLGGQPVPAVLQEDGSYLIEGVPPGRHRVAVVARNGMIGGYATVEVPAAGRVRAPDIVARLGGQIVGLVSVLSDGVWRALAGVEVTARPAFDFGPDRPVVAMGAASSESYSAFTNAFGSYVIPAVPEGDYIVTVHSPEMASAWQWVFVTPGRTAAVDFQLLPAPDAGVGTVQGRVYERTEGGAQRPLAGARVSIISDMPWEPIGPIELPPGPPLDDPEDGGDAGEPGFVPGWPGPDDFVAPWVDMVSTITRADGTFTLNAPAGYATIEVYLPGYEPQGQSIIVVAEETLTINLQLQSWTDVPYPDLPVDHDWPGRPEWPPGAPVLY